MNCRLYGAFEAHTKRLMNGWKLSADDHFVQTHVAIDRLDPAALCAAAHFFHIVPRVPTVSHSKKLRVGIKSSPMIGGQVLCAPIRSFSALMIVSPPGMERKQIVHRDRENSERERRKDRRNANEKDNERRRKKINGTERKRGKDEEGKKIARDYMVFVNDGTFNDLSTSKRVLF